MPLFWVLCCSSAWLPSCFPCLVWERLGGGIQMWVPPHGVISEVGSSAPAPGKLFLGPIAAGNCPPKRPVSPTSLVPSQGKEGRWNRSKVESRHPSPLVPSVLLACFLIYFQSHILPRDTNTPFVWGFPKRSHKCTPCMPEKTHRWLLRAGFYKHVPPDLRQVLLGRARPWTAVQASHKPDTAKLAVCFLVAHGFQ